MTNSVTSVTLDSSTNDYKLQTEAREAERNELNQNVTQAASDIDRLEQKVNLVTGFLKAFTAVAIANGIGALAAACFVNPMGIGFAIAAVVCAIVAVILHFVKIDAEGELANSQRNLIDCNNKIDEFNRKQKFINLNTKQFKASL